MSSALDAPTPEHAKPIDVGARVRHSGQGFSKAVREGTAVVVRAVPWSDGSWEYEVRSDGETETRWWASYRTIRVSVGE